ncbi:MAG TPA: Si-specific NAD(P)(+) transhydrogenase [candidate division Zixibacteria bacterium]|nr:Si-specific NAD(P)(+) transhydrogenase [candidate division Zixibacteria bacterium]
MSEKHFDLIVIGSGPAGEKAAIEAAKMHKTTAIVERHSVQGGVCIHTGTIPSKTLRETVLYISGLRQRSAYGLMGGVRPNVTVRELMYRKDQVIQEELDVIQQNMARHRIEVIQGTGSLTGSNRVKVVGDNGIEQSLTAEAIVLSTGTRPYHPDDIDFDHKFIYDGESILNLDILPQSLTIIGGGVIGCEYACIFAHLGINVTIVDDREQLLSFLDREIVEALMYLMRKYRITLNLGDGADQVEIRNNQVIVVTKRGRKIVSDRLLYAAGRVGNTESLGLDKVGIEVNKRGLIKVDGQYETGVKGIYAVGDVIGFPSLASVSMDQGRLAALHAFRKNDTSCINTLLPYGIYTIPEVSMVGETEETLTEAGHDYSVGIARFFELARGQIINDHDGLLKLIFDAKSRRILGVHIVGERATELIHIGQAVMTHGGTLDYFVDTVFNYPTLTEAYKVAALDGFARLSQLF